jgi:hypothetical protein
VKQASVVINTPSAGSTVEGALTVSGSSSDSYGIVGISVQVDSDGWQPALGTTSWTFALDTTQYGNGAHTITAQMSDLAGHTRSTTISILIANSSSAPGTAPGQGGANGSGLGATFYVSRSGSGSYGTSWATAWNEMADINWAEVQPGDTIVIDGGSTQCAPQYSFTGTRPGLGCGMEYDTTLNVGTSGTPTAPITIRLAPDAGHNGTAVLFGGRTVPLPYCHQTNYDGQAVRQYGIDIGSNHDVVIDGMHTSGMMVYGAVQGVEVPSSSPGDLTFERMEVFDNGSIVMPTTWAGPGYTSDNQGFSLGGGPNDALVGDLIHDNGNDEVSDSNETGRAAGSLNGLTLKTDWFYNEREHPLYPGEPFNDLQAIGDTTCLHNDGVQLSYGGTGQGPMVVQGCIFGPLLNQGLYPGDGGTGSTWTDVTVEDSLFVSIRHNVITDNPVHGWTIDHDTLFAEQGGFEIPSNGPNTITNTVKYKGYVYTPNWNGTTSGDDWYLGDPLPGTSTNVNPNFVGPVPTATLNGFAAYEAANFTPQCALCQGSSLYTLAAIVSNIAELAS